MVELWFLLPTALVATLGTVCLGVAVFFLPGISLSPQDQATLQETLKRGPPYPWMFGTFYLLGVVVPKLIKAGFAACLAVTALLWARLRQRGPEASGLVRPGWGRRLLRVAAFLIALGFYATAGVVAVGSLVLLLSG